jgi:hypothetical protein
MTTDGVRKPGRMTADGVRKPGSAGYSPHKLSTPPPGERDGQALPVQTTGRKCRPPGAVRAAQPSRPPLSQICRAMSLSLMLRSWDTRRITAKASSSETLRRSIMMPMASPMVCRVSTARWS